MAYFQGGDFVELLSAQGKAPAASWKLQGKISKTFDKGIRGNAFQLDGSSETKMQLPKTSSSSLGLAQRFVVLQLLVPFTRSFSVEICYSDFQKVRRRFVIASAFRDIARTTLHVQLPLNDVHRDQWMNLVFDLQSLSEMHFPDSGYRSMESICVGGSCRLKRIFTMKDAPTPSRGAQAVKHADVRDIPRQFVFSATQRGAGKALPIPTWYFAGSTSGIGSVHGVAITANSVVSNDTSRSARRGQTAPMNAQAKQQVKGGRAVRPITGVLQRNTQAPATPPDPDANKPCLRTPASVNTTDTKLRQRQSKVGKLVVAKQESPSRYTEPASPGFHVPGGSRQCAWESEECLETTERSVSPVRVSKSRELKKEDLMAATSLTLAQSKDRSIERVLSPPSSVLSSVMASPHAKDSQSARRSQTLRQSIMGEIQQKIASLEADDERADQRDRELFLRHTSLHSGEWHLQKLHDDALDDDDAALLSDDEDGHIELSSSWRKELAEPATDLPSPETTQRRSRDGMSADKESLLWKKELAEPTTITSSEVNQRRSRDGTSHGNEEKKSIFSFCSLDPETTFARKSATRLFDFDSLLQDVKSLSPLQSNPNADTESLAYQQLETKIESALADVDSDGDDLELTKLLAAKRTARQLQPQKQDKIDRQSLPQPSGEPSMKEMKVHAVNDDTQELRLSRNASTNPSDRDDWVVVEKGTTDAAGDMAIDFTQTSKAIQDQEWHLDQQLARDGDSDIDTGDEENELSIDLTSELGGGSDHNLGDDDAYEDSVGRTDPASLHTAESKPESDHDSSNSHHNDESSFDFEDLVENAEESDSRDEDDDKHFQSTDKVASATSQRKPIVTATRLPRDLDPKISSSPHGKQFIRENRRPLPELPLSARSPMLDSRQSTQSKFQQRESRERILKASNPIELSSSFSSQRLQRLLESTDWTAELNAQASSGLHELSTSRNSDQKQKPGHYHSPASSSNRQRSTAIGSTRRSIQRSSSRPQTPSESSIELVYDPLLRCYYDPVANKYYALAE